MSEIHASQQPIVFDPALRDAAVLVGFDGSTQALQALHYGALAAQRSGRALTVVTAYTVSSPAYSFLAKDSENSEAQAAAASAKSVLAKARTYLRDYPGKVFYRVERGDAAGVLVDLSAVAEVVVIGSRGRGGFVGRIMGSVASALPAHAHCPTVVVHRQYGISDAEGAARFVPPPDQRPVIVGIDRSKRSRVAALHAAQTAENCGTNLHMLMALPSLEGWMDWYPELSTTDRGMLGRRHSQLDRNLQAEVHWMARHYPSLVITAAVKPGEPVTLLSRATSQAQLTVMGTRGRGGFAGALLGSVSREVLLRAAGPVMVVPDMEDKRLSDQPETFS
ncbi:universal stress protein [Nesterenkonia natronophila]|uniref:Universal stress protein n=1 Tax=Nesterenkonia natronophila TaxID=2174932 RepID=A0A3A4F8Q3_9MICC|nr:universal stress protein [Nesterenkonia natronophila]RJN32860.1 universal stress protein [Nesterenkonia natronophila]